MVFFFLIHFVFFFFLFQYFATSGLRLLALMSAASAPQLNFNSFSSFLLINLVYCSIRNSTSSILLHIDVALCHDGGGVLFISRSRIAFSRFRFCVYPPRRFIFFTGGVGAGVSGLRLCCRLLYSSRVSGFGPSLFFSPVMDPLLKPLTDVVAVSSGLFSWRLVLLEHSFWVCFLPFVLVLGVAHRPDLYLFKNCSLTGASFNNVFFFLI